MAAANGPTPSPVGIAEALCKRSASFTLFAALRAIESLSPDRPRIGTAARPAAELVRLTQVPHLGFAPAEVARIEAGARWRVDQYGFGILGPNGALPLHLTELVFDRARHHDDTTLGDFINALQHRWIALFYRAWSQTEPVSQADRPWDDEFLDCLRALIGLDTGDIARNAAIGNGSLAARAGTLVAAARSADGLETLLQDYFGMRLDLKPFIGGRLDIPSDERLRLGGAQDSVVGLGQGATLGGTTWQVGDTFELVIDPVDQRGLEHLLPGGQALAEFVELVRMYTNDEWQWQLRVLVDRSSVPGVRLGSVKDAQQKKTTGGTRLGLTAWIGDGAGIATDVVLRSGALFASTAAF